MADFFYWLGDFFYWIFETLLEPLGNLPNQALIGLGFIGLFVWLKMQSDYNKEAKSKGTLR